MTLVLMLLLASVAAVKFKQNSESGALGVGLDASSKDFVDDESNSHVGEKHPFVHEQRELHENRLLRDQRRIEIAVAEALLKDANEPKFPAQPTFKAKSFQLVFTTLLDRLPNDNVGLNIANPVFGPAAIVAYTAPSEGLFGPNRTRAQVIGLDTRNTFGTLFSEIRRAGFLGEFDLRTLVQSDSTFTVSSRALVTPCFPVTDEPGLTFEVIVLIQGVDGQVRRKYLAIDRFFDSDHNFVDLFTEELFMSRFDATNSRFDQSTQPVVIVTGQPCEQFSYFSSDGPLSENN